MNSQKIKFINICDKIILFSLYAVAYFLPISKAIIESLSILAIICFIFKKIIQHEGIANTHLNIGIFSYIIICFISIFISSNLEISARTFFAKTMQNIVFFFVVVDTLNTERRIRNLIYIFFVSSLLLGIDGIYQYFTHKEFIRHRKYYGIPRIHATFPSANDFGCYLASMIPFSIVGFFTNKFRFKLFRFLFIGLTVLLLICLMLTVSRGAWFAFLAAILFMSTWINKLGIFFFGLAALIAFLLSFYHPYIKERLSNFFVFFNKMDLDREMVWTAAWKMFMSRPWLGVGLGTFMFNFQKFVVPSYPYGVSYAHNCYLQMSAEIGIIGLVSFLSILALFFYHGIKAISIRKKNFSWYILVATFAAVLGYCVQMSVDTTFYSLDLGMLFWLLLGLGTAAMKMQSPLKATSKV